MQHISLKPCGLVTILQRSLEPFFCKKSRDSYLYHRMFFEKGEDPEKDETIIFQHENGCTEYEKAVDCELQCEIPMPFPGRG